MRKRVKRPLLLAAGVAALLSLGGCMYDGGTYNDGYYDGRYQSDDDYYDGYYDGSYGPYAGGYWAIDGFFYYWLRDRYYRDDQRHFRRDRFPGGSHFRGDRDGATRWQGPGYRPPQGQQQLPPPAHPPRQRQRPGGS